MRPWHAIASRPGAGVREVTKEHHAAMERGLGQRIERSDNDRSYVVLLSGGDLLRVMASIGHGWEHVSVSLDHRCPSWAEMCLVKDISFATRNARCSFTCLAPNS